MCDGVVLCNYLLQILSLMNLRPFVPTPSTLKLTIYNDS